MHARAEQTFHSEMSQLPTLEARLQSAGDVTHRKSAEDFGRFWKSQRVALRTGHRRRRLTFACSRRPLWRVPHVLGGGRWKSQNRKIVPLFQYVEEPLNSKVIKSFVPEQRSRQVFFVFRDSYVLCSMYIYIWTSHIHFAYSCIWIWYRVKVSQKSIMLLQKKNGDVNGRAQLINLKEYHSEKENIVCPVSWGYIIYRLHLCRSVRLPQLVFYGPVDWSYIIHWLHLCRGVRLPQRVSLI